MNNTPYRYKFEFNSISIVGRLESGYNIFDTLKEAKEYGCKNLDYLHEGDYPAFRERLRLVTKEELFDELFEYLELTEEQV